MALLRICNSPDFLSGLSRVSNTARVSLNEMQCTRNAAVHRIKALHLTSVRRYPEPPTLPLPTNVSEIFANETGRFTPERSRDIAAPILIYSRNADHASFPVDHSAKSSITNGNVPSSCNDAHVDSYDCFGAVNLCGTMQSNVPKPFCSTGKSMHLNMPGGQWSRDGKYIAEDMQKSHYRTVRLPQLKLDADGTAIHGIVSSTILRTLYRPNSIFNMRYSTDASKPAPTGENDTKPSRMQKLRTLVTLYGNAILVFHITISLISLGGCYAAVASGLDLTPYVKMICNENTKLEEILDYSSTFVLAYSIHKIFAPIRFMITFTCAPLLVTQLRRYRILKASKLPASKTK